MIPIHISLRIVFNQILRERKENRNDPGLSQDEKDRIGEFMFLNCPAFNISEQEITTLFSSFCRHRFRKRIKKPSTQLSLYV